MRYVVRARRAALLVAMALVTAASFVPAGASAAPVGTGPGRPAAVAPPVPHGAPVARTAAVEGRGSRRQVDQGTGVFRLSASSGPAGTFVTASSTTPCPLPESARAVSVQVVMTDPHGGTTRVPATVDQTTGRWTTSDFAVTDVAGSYQTYFGAGTYDVAATCSAQATDDGPVGLLDYGAQSFAASDALLITLDASTVLPGATVRITTSNSCPAGSTTALGQLFYYDATGYHTVGSTTITLLAGVWSSMSVRLADSALVENLWADVTCLSGSRPTLFYYSLPMHVVQVAVPAPTSVYYVALGDSYSSGEGVDPYLRDGYRPGKTGAADNRCHRSTRAYTAQARASASAKPWYVVASGSARAGTGGSVDKYGSDANVRQAAGVTWVDWACSGATMANVWPAAQGGKQQRRDNGESERFTQLDNPSVYAAASVVTLTIGGNDLDFADILQHCALHACDTKSYRGELDGRIDALKPQLAKTYAQIAARMPHARVYVLGYPQLFPKTSDEQKCKKLKPWRGEQSMLRQKADRFNDLIESEAHRAGMTFVDTASVFAKHEVCGSKADWLNGPSLTGKPDRWFVDDESFHPNLAGQSDGYGSVVRGLKGS